MFTVNRTDAFRKWLKKLKDRKAKAQILLRLKNLEKGEFGDHHYLRERIWELVFDIGPGYRVYFAKKGNEIILILCAGNKSSQKRDIKKAIRMLAEVEKNNG